MGSIGAGRLIKATDATVVEAEEISAERLYVYWAGDAEINEYSESVFAPSK